MAAEFDVLLQNDSVDNSERARVDFQYETLVVDDEQMIAVGSYIDSGEFNSFQYKRRRRYAPVVGRHLAVIEIERRCRHEYVIVYVDEFSDDSVRPVAESQLDLVDTAPQVHVFLHNNHLSTITSNNYITFD